MVPYGERGSCSECAIVPNGHANLKDERFPQFAPPARGQLAQIGSPTPRPCRSLVRSLTPPPSRTHRALFTNVKETKMTYSLEIQIEELRAELAACADWDERIDSSISLRDHGLSHSLACFARQFRIRDPAFVEAVPGREQQHPSLVRNDGPKSAQPFQFFPTDASMRLRRTGLARWTAHRSGLCSSCGRFARYRGGSVG